MKRFRIAFSFAGKKRDFVAKVAEILATRFGEHAILYDKYHEAEFARRDLGIYLPELYHNESDLAVVVVCPQYNEKEWTGLEWAAVHDLLKKRKDNEVMLFRFEHAEVAGIYSTAGFVELDGKTPEMAAELILERLALNDGRPKNYYTLDATLTGSHGISTPNNLPRLQAFFGRTEELRQIAEALDPEARTWGALIDGPGGMGKTSLAVSAAYACRPGQFNRIIFLSVKERELDDDGERELGPFILPGFLEMLNELARELGQPEITRATESERIRLTLAALEPARVLLILDNLESLTKADRDQLFTFVKRLPQGCKAILTSRRRIGSSADVLILERLDEDSALETLADLAAHNPLLGKTTQMERRSLYQETAGNPLLLRWVAGQLGRGSCRTISDALAFLGTCPSNNDPLEFIFGDLANEFTAEETSILAALTYFTLPAKVEHVATVSGLNKESVETGLRALANRSLVVPDQEERAFSLVPLVGDFLRRKRPEVVAEAGKRVEQHALALIVEHGFKKHDHFSALDENWPTVAPALALFIAGPNERLQTVCKGLFMFLNFTGRWDESLSLNTQAEARAVAASDHESAGLRAYQIGWIHYLREESAPVLECANRAANHWQLATPGAERILAIQMRGLSHMLKHDYPAAIVDYSEVLELCRAVSADSQPTSIALNDLAEAERFAGNLDAAESDYRESLRIARASGNTEGEATSTSNLAALALDRKNWTDAETFSREALTLSEKIGRQEMIAGNCRLLAISFALQNKTFEALPYAKRAVEIFTRLRSPRVEGARETLEVCEEIIETDRILNPGGRRT